MQIRIRHTGNSIFCRSAGCLDFRCLIIIKFDNLVKKSDIEIKKLYNKIKGRK